MRKIIPVTFKNVYARAYTCVKLFSHSQTLGGRKVIRLAGKVRKTLEKYGAIAQQQPAIRQPGFFGFVTTKILKEFLCVLCISLPVSALIVKIVCMKES